jgi:hypothetical protein
MKKRYLVIFLRLFFGLLTFTAIIVQIIHVVHLHAFNPVNFFSYFTNLSNIFAGFVLVASAMYLAGSRKPSATDDLVRGAVTMYMVITGVVYSLLLSGYELGHLLPWVNIVLHYIMPIVVLADWLCQPQRTKITAKQGLWWLVFPMLYLVYSLIRGPIAHWYPYPFLNPDKTGGYAGVAAYCVVILLGFLSVSWAMRALGRRLPRHLA